MKILVVDDEMIVLESCRLVLEAEGFEIALTSSAEQGLEAIADGNFAVLLMDVKMPGHDGLYLMQEVKKKWPDMPMIVMSGYATTETISDVFKLGASAFIAKPFTPDELLEAIRRVLQEDKGHEKEKGLGD